MESERKRYKRYSGWVEGGGKVGEKAERVDEPSDGDANANTTSSVTAAHLERVVTLQRVLSGSCIHTQ